MYSDSIDPLTNYPAVYKVITISYTLPAATLKLCNAPIIALLHNEYYYFGYFQYILRLILLYTLQLHVTPAAFRPISPVRGKAQADLQRAPSKKENMAQRTVTQQGQSNTRKGTFLMDYFVM